MFDRRVSKSLLYENVVKKLVEMIDRGIVNPGEQFPTERELVESMEVSRNVLREAFHILEERGIIFSIQGRGRFLKRIPDKRLGGSPTALELQKYSLLELYQVRAILEQGTMDILVESATEEDIADLEAKFEELLAFFRENRTTKGEFQMHMAYARKTHNEYLQSLLQETVDRVFRMMWGDFSRVASTYEIEAFVVDHTKILNAIKRRDAMEARSIIREHIGHTSRDIEHFSTNQTQ